MIKGRLWRFLLFFFTIYLVMVFLFIRSFNSDDGQTTTTSLSPHVQAIIKDHPLEKPNIQHHVVVRDAGKSPSNLAPVMTKGIPGNYELKNHIQSSGPGEGGEGVQLQGNDVQLGKDSVAEYGFNEVASEKISLDRRARDTRYIFTRTQPFLRLIP